jgi:hypothetical protein
MQDPENPIPNQQDDESQAEKDSNQDAVDQGTIVEDEMSDHQEGIAGESEAETGEDELPSPTPEVLPISEDLEPLEEVEPVETEMEESRARRFFRGLIRWTAGILIIFGLGLITGIYAFHRPAIQKAEATIQQLRSDLDSKNAQIQDLQNQIADLKAQVSALEPFEETNQELLGAQSDFRLHIAILDARVDVANALLSLSKGETAQARVLLNNTGDTIDRINDLLEADQRDVVAAMAQRLELVLSEIDDDPYAAESDLDVLATNLLQLEDALFAD